MSEFLGAIALIAFFYFVNKIAESISARKKARQKQQEEPKPKAAPKFEIPAPAGACAGGHQFAEAYGGEYVYDTPYVPAHMRSCATNRCRVCGCREKRLPGPEDMPQGDVPQALKDKLTRYGKIRDMSQQDLARLIRNPEEDLDYRKYAAEMLTDQALILDLLRESHMKDPSQDDTAVWTRLAWQLPADGPFEKVAADPAYPKGARAAIIARILDMDALERLSTDPDIAEACAKQRPEALCREGHDWKVIGTKIEAHDSYRMNSPYWVIDTYRCSRCGKTRQGEMYRTMTSPYARDDD